LSLKSWIRLAVVTVIVGGVVGLLAYGFTRDARYIRSPLVAKTAPSFTLALFDGKVIKLEEFRGKVVFLNFWASWCVPCREEAKSLEAAWKKYKDQGVVFVGVSIQDKEEDARNFIQEFGITYRNGIDKAGKIGIDYGVWGIPETFFIDHGGRITYKHVGGISVPTIVAKLDQARLGMISAEEGKGEYRSIR
jgi:cytochrome c biogenesis protein CcmG/thiol:disulfide interchange protein DsbE